MNQAIQFPDRGIMGCRTAGCGFSCAGQWDAINLRNFRTEPAAAFWCRGASAVAGRLPEHRWDLEEEVEALIRDGQEDAQGWIWLS